MPLTAMDSETGIEQLTKADAEERAWEKVEQGKAREQAARIAAENRVRELEEELRRLRGGNT